MEKEPLIYNEQGVVYLFSKYWNDIQKSNCELNVKIDKITDTHVYFPDFMFIDDKGIKFGLEFEYYLSKFNHYSQLNNLKDEDIKNLLIIYWIKDYDERKIKKKLKDQGIATKFICLKDYFCIHVEKKGNELLDYLIFCSDKKKGDKLILNLKEIYPYALIEKGYKQLSKLIKEEYKKGGIVDNNRYRVLGHNISDAGGVDIVYWKYIHFYTTTGRIVAEGKIPQYILFMSANERRICAIIEPKIVFSFYKTKFKDKNLVKFYKEFYFFEPYKPDKKEICKCVIYDKMINIPKKQGEDLFDIILKVKKNMQQNGFAINKLKEEDLFNKISKKVRMYLKCSAV